MNTDAKAYKEVDTIGKAPVDLVLQVYDGALSEIGLAKTKYVDQKYSDGYNNIQRAERMVTHLYTTLDMEQGGEVAANLAKLYIWVITKLHEVQATKDTARFDECAKVLRNLRQAWEGVKEQSVAAKSETGAILASARLEVVG